MGVIYTNGKFHSASVNNVSSMMQAFNYGTAAFEGMKAYYHEQQKKWFIFRPELYYERLQRSCWMIDIELGIRLEEFVAVIGRLIKRNDIRGDVYIRPLVYRDQKGVGLTRPSGRGISIFVQPIPYKSANAFKCCFVSQRRPNDGTYAGKLTGNYLLSYFSAKEAIQRGYDVGILLSTEGYVAEASIMNLFFVQDGNLHTPSLNCGPLAGITRRSIIELARSLPGVKVSEGRYRSARLLEADEIFFTGTGSGINFVSQLETRKFRLNRRDRLAPRLSEAFADICYGRNPKYSNWLVPAE